MAWRDYVCSTAFRLSSRHAKACTTNGPRHAKACTTNGQRHAEACTTNKWGARLRAFAEKDGRGYPDWALRYVPIVRYWRRESRKGERIVEIGANANGFARFAGARVIAVDRSSAHLEEARAAQAVLPVVADAAALPFRRESVDWCLCVDTLEHVPEAMRDTALGELARVTAARGHCLVAFPAGDAARKAEEHIRAKYREYTGGRISWLEEHAVCPLPDPAYVAARLGEHLAATHNVTRGGNANLWVWRWTWRVLMCGWPGRGNAVFQALLRILTPLLCRLHFPPYYRAVVWAYPRQEPATSTVSPQ